jgi:probable HAF family extracellular repeat protein
MTDLGALGSLGTRGYGINDAGQVTGESYITPPVGGTRAFLYTNGQMIDLGTLGGSLSSGLAINNAGQVTGRSTTASNSGSHAFLYSNGQMIDLNSVIDPTLGITLYTATAINAHGQIVADGFYDGNFSDRAFLLTPISPVPEPGTWAMLGGALVSLLVGHVARLIRMRLV